MNTSPRALSASVKLQQKLQTYQREGRALLATNFYNFETLQAIMKACQESKEPIILQITESSIDYMGLEIAVKMARAALASFQVEGWIHLDHGASLNLVQRCLDAGVDSVMIDGSEKPFAENVAITKKAVDLASTYGANVEAELGYVAKLGQSTEKMEYTTADEARRFVDETGINALAVAIGTAHGFYKSEPKLDLTRLQEIRGATKAFLVLHGSSGVPDHQIQKSIQCGICKINLATELKNIFMKTLKDSVNKSEDIDLRRVFPPAIEAVRAVVSTKLSVIRKSSGT